MAQDPATQHNKPNDATFKVVIPKSADKYSSKQEAINTAKCQMYQWLEVMKIPSPHRSRMYVETIKKQYPSLQFNNEIYNQWLEEIGTIYRDKYGINDNNDNENEEKNNDNNPKWLSLQNGNINNLLLDKYGIHKGSINDRCLGCILGIFIVDALGAPVEGWPYHSIIEQYNEKGVINMIPGTHMGARAKGPRCGYYTDDTMTTMALALSIVQKQKLCAQHAAENYYKFWKTNPIYRGLPGSAQKVLTDVISGMSIKITGRQSFADGSYANGGAMRISPVGLSFRNASHKVLKAAVIDAVLSSHCHKQSIDGALCIALMIQYALKCDLTDNLFDYGTLTDILMENIETQEMKDGLQSVVKGYDAFLNEYNDSDGMERDSCDGILDYDIAFLEETGLLTFQIKAIEAVPFVLYCLLRWYKNPQQCAINVVTLGGDCDTTGSMIGGILGCLYGTCWIPNRWYHNLENTWKEEESKNDETDVGLCVGVDAYGLDLALYLGMELSKLNFMDYDCFVETETKSVSVMTKIKNLFPSKSNKKT